MSEVEVTDAVVCGSSLPALQTALDLAEVGLTVAVVISTPGEVEARHVELDPEGAIEAFLQRIAEPIEGREGEASAAVMPSRVIASPPLLRGRDGAWHAQSEPNVLGIPAVILAEASIRLMGMGAALRAYTDRFKPVLTVGKTRTLGELVRKRLGNAVLQRLVEPQVLERYGASASLVEVAVAAPGLNEALTRTGALSSAVLAYSERNAARETRVTPAESWGAVASSLLHRLELYDVRLIEGEVSQAQKRGDGWSIELASGARIDAGAVVLDQGDHPVPDAIFAEHLDTLAPDFARVHAAIDIQSPGCPETGGSALLHSGEWSLRVETPEQGVPRARLSSTAVDVASLNARANSAPDRGDLSHRFLPVDEQLIAELEAVLDEAGVTPRAGAGWLFRVAAAPFTTLIEHEASREARERLAAEHPTLLPVGRALHGDDLGLALTTAHRGAVALRRRLLGLEA